MKPPSILRLLNNYSKIIDALIARGVLRTRNNPVSDYAEWLFSQALQLKLMNNSSKGYDALDKSGKVTYQIKTRRIATEDGTPGVLGVIRGLEKRPFHYLGVVFFNNDFTVRHAYIVPHSIVTKYAYPNKHQNGHVLRWNSAIAAEPRVKDVTKKLKAFSRNG